MFIRTIWLWKNYYVKNGSWFEVATSGDILIGNKNVNNLDTRDRNLAMAFQFYALYPSLTVAENLANPLHAENLSDDEIKKKNI